MLRWWVGVLLMVAGGAGATTFCPQHCSCFTDPDGYISANCSTLALGAVEPSSVELLSLQPRLGGYPTKLVPRAFLSFQKVKFLWAINCSVLNLPNEVFHGLSYVIRIDLSYNKIRHLNGGVFKNLGSLTTLKLRANPLELTPWDVVVSDSLQELDLGYCGLRTIPYGTFVSVPGLSRLYLDGNELRTFTYNAIPAGLRYVNLARNRISNVPTDVLSTMSYLRKLDLSKNPVNCTCKLLIMQDWFSGQGIILENGVTCTEPSQYAGMRLSKINENELCSLEEVKRQRRINDIQSYRDSKSHRTHNMIHDPDFQSDQPSGQIYAEVLFHDDGTRGLTHMELSDKHYPPLPSDLSDENNKVVTSKQELTPTDIEFSSPTQEAKTTHEETSREELSPSDLPVNITDPDSHEDETTEGHSTVNSDDVHITNLDDNIPLHSKLPEIEHTTDISNWEHTSIITSDDLLSGNFTFQSNDTRTEKTAHEEMADEGYSPVFNVSDVFVSEVEEGSGIDPMDIATTDFTKEESSTSPQPFTFPSSSSSGEDYHYDSIHDYSGEVSSTTESMTTTFIEEGSGDAENETASVWSDNYENGTTSESYVTVDNSTDDMFSTSQETTSEDYSLSSPQYNSSSESEVTDEPTSTEAPTTAIFWEPSSGYSSTESSSTESSSSSSTPDLLEFDTTEVSFSSSESQRSSTEEPSSTLGSAFALPESSPSSSAAPTTSSESPSSSSSGYIIPEIHTELPVSREPEESTTSPTLRPTSAPPIFHPPSSTQAPISEVEIIKETANDVKSQIRVSPTKEGLEKEVKPEAAHATLTYVIIGLLIALVLLVATTVVCRKVSSMRPCASKKKVRLPQDTEANHGTEMQDMLLPKPPENGVKIIPQNGTQNGKDVKEEEVPVLQKDWEEKPEPIETVTARMSILAGPQTPVFIHKTLA